MNLDVRVFVNSNGYTGIEVFNGRKRLICDYSSTSKEIELMMDTLDKINNCDFEVIEEQGGY